MNHIGIGYQVHDLPICTVKLSSCDLSPPLKPVIGGSSKVHKMSYIHPNSIPLVVMGSMRQEEDMRKDPF